MSHSSNMPGVVASLIAANRHVNSEYKVPFDLEGVLATVAEDATFIKIDRQGVIDTTVTEAGVRDFYDRLRQNFTPLGAIHLAQVVTDWYSVFESIPQRVDPATGKAYQTRTVALFPTRGGRIVGEINCEVPIEAGEVSRIDDSVNLSIRNALAHDDLLTNMVLGNIEAAVAAFNPDATLLTQVRRAGPLEPVNIRTGAAAQRLALEEIAHRFQDIQITVLNRLVSSWFVFSELFITARLRAGLGRMRALQTVSASAAQIAAFDQVGRIRQLISYVDNIAEINAPQPEAGHAPSLIIGCADHRAKPSA